MSSIYAGNLQGFCRIDWPPSSLHLSIGEKKRSHPDNDQHNSYQRPTHLKRLQGTGRVTIDQVPLSIHCRDHENKDPTDEQQDKINEHDKARETGFGEDRCLNSGL
jgi:hypothetical protein